MFDIMLDLETMGTGPTAAIIAIGAVSFEPITGEVGGEFYRVVDLASSVEGGGKIDASTVLWWMKQGDAAREEFGRVSAPICVALEEFSAWVMEQAGSSPKIWGNGAAFDNVILRSAYERAGITPPWRYSNDRCYRTVRALWPDVKSPAVGTAHNALDDALYQAQVLIKILRAEEK